MKLRNGNKDEKKSSRDQLIEWYKLHLENPKKVRMCPEALAGGLLCGKITRDEDFDSLVEMGVGLQSEAVKLVTLVENEDILKQVAIRYLENNIDKYKNLIESTFFFDSEENCGIIAMCAMKQQLKEEVAEELPPLDKTWFDSVTNKTYKVKQKLVRFG